jgi:hypothetical protein
MTRETTVPAIPDVRDDNVKEVLSAIKATLEVREGHLGDPLDQLVTMRDLLALNVGETGVAGARTNAGVVLPLGPILLPPVDGYNPSTDFTTPAQPSGLRASGGFTNIYLEWDGAPYRNHGYTEIWRSQLDVLGSAVLIGTTVANVYADAANANTTYFYWIRFVSEANITGPYNSTSGTPATTAIDVTSALSAITNDIASSQLFVDLGTRIAATETGITTLQQITATSAQQVTTLSSVVGKNQSSIEIAAKVTDGLSAQYTVKIDVNGHVSGFGLASSSATGTPTSAFIVRADRFAITGANSTTDPLGTLNPTSVPFVVLTTPTVIGGVTYPAGVWMKSAFIADATITNAQIQNLTADKITTGSLTAAVGITTGYVYGGVSPGGIYPPGHSFFGTGFFLGQWGGVYQSFVGSPTKQILWDGTNLTVKGQIAASSATFAGLTITDNSGNVLLSSGGINGSYVTGLGSLAYQNSVTTGQVSGLGALATQNNVFVGSTVRFADGTVMNTGDFVNRLAQINSTNISTFIASAAIGDAYIGNLNASKITAGTIAADRLDSTIITGKVANLDAAVIQNATISTLKLGGETVFIPRYGEQTSTGVTLTEGSLTGDLASVSTTVSGLGGGETVRIIVMAVSQCYPSDATQTNLLYGIYVNGTLNTEIGATFRDFGITVANLGTFFVGNGTFTTSVKASCKASPGGSSSKASNNFVTRIIVMAGKR